MRFVKNDEKPIIEDHRLYYNCINPNEGLDWVDSKKNGRDAGGREE